MGLVKSIGDFGRLPTLHRVGGRVRASGSLDFRNGAGFSDDGMTAVRRALADVGEAPRHEVAGDVGRGCAGLYGDLPIAPVLAMIAGGAPVARLDARSGTDRAVFEA
jgi:hypothetical protein